MLVINLPSIGVNIYTMCESISSLFIINYKPHNEEGA
jgi:hypothetical protein